ncbi:MAG: TonB family protein, partial [Acidobacteria bacterium]|nr:TonB family protein [Acidobacteriota bacterium]
YIGQRMLQQTFYGGAKVRYQANGQALHAKEPGSWTVDADLQCKKVLVKRRKLVIEGNRLYFIYDKKVNRLKPYLGPKAEIDIETGNGPVSISALQHDIANVFMTGQERLVDFVPSYWKPFLLQPDKQVHKMALGPLSAGRGRVTPPKLLLKRAPPSTPEARNAGLHGTMILSIIVGKKGRVTRPSIIRPLGLGLDDSAARTVEKWKFEPATRGGKPVAVRERIEVSFVIRSGG